MSSWGLSSGAVGNIGSGQLMLHMKSLKHKNADSKRNKDVRINKVIYRDASLMQTGFQNSVVPSDWRLEGVQVVRLISLFLANKRRKIMLTKIHTVQN